MSPSELARTLRERAIVDAHRQESAQILAYAFESRRRAVSDLAKALAYEPPFLDPNHDRAVEVRFNRLWHADRRLSTARLVWRECPR